MAQLSAKMKARVEAIAEAVLLCPADERGEVCWQCIEFLAKRLGGSTPPENLAPVPILAEGRTKPQAEPVFEVLPPTFIESGKAGISLKDYCDQIVLSKKYDKLLVVVAWLQEELKVFPITISEIMTSLRYLRWLVEPDPIKLRNAIYAINSEHDGRFFVNIDSGWNLVLSLDGLAYVEALPRRKRRGSTR